MADDPAKAIARNNKRKHAHNDPDDLEFCDKCGSFISTDDPDSAGRIRYQCGACGHAGMNFLYDPSNPART